MAGGVYLQYSMHSMRSGVVKERIFINFELICSGEDQSDGAGGSKPRARAVAQSRRRAERISSMETGQGERKGSQGVVVSLLRKALSQSVSRLTQQSAQPRVILHQQPSLLVALSLRPSPPSECQDRGGEAKLGEGDNGNRLVRHASCSAKMHPPCVARPMGHAESPLWHALD